MANNGGVVSGCAGERTAVTSLLLYVRDDGTLRALGDGKDVADGESSLLASVDKGTGVEALGGNEGLLAELVPVGVAEDDTGEGSTTMGRSECDSRNHRQSTYRPESWIISFTIPLTYPLRSAKSRGRNCAGALLWWVCDLNYTHGRICSMEILCETNGRKRTIA